jgi:D-3-phosphoglycerate dehydrogenase / 2-oxoglutarate reductase
MAKFRVLMTDTIFPDTTIEQEELRRIDAEFVLASASDPETLKREGQDCDAALNVYAQLGADVLGAWKRCKVIVRTGIGFNTIDLETAAARRIMVANVPDYCMDEVADHTVALFLACVRKIPLLHAGVKTGRWSVDLAKPTPRLQGKLYGLFGFGNIAQRVAKRIQAFGLQVMAFDPYLPAELFAAQQVARAASLEALLGAVDFLSVHAPLTEETRGILNAARLKLLKPTAIVVNTSRGPLINDADLLAALCDGTLAGAGLDVLTDEPPTYPLALAALDNVVLTPHTAWYSDDAMPELRRKASAEVARTLTEGRPRFWVNQRAFSG